MGKARHGLLLAAALSMTVSSATGCIVTPRAAASLATAAIWAAAIAGTVFVLETHDEHFHYEHCGHYRRYHEGRWVYYYEDRWEYCDDTSGAWYFYAD